ncbi:hypothetical protein L228DRAFT_39554 [Xylona heveae TC161]|uniref:VHS domain-containing protein n=1 Tax=Xylona heveae (strain CBS 132557 / TC161) TaxID=1328760 RepID=A0A164ZZ01_XYLHT|nr:hypothetical protein L228DRAFT_39554 [Xylona heveae TC161]KZF19724.1 hypothetical protein L228DRAFT_39554 [Xylona heveae TC161]
MQKLKESFKKRGSQDIGSRSSPGSPEGDVVKNVRSFCDSNAKQDEEILFLPVIVEAASASPTAAKEAAYVIRKVLVKDASRSQSQYNAIMLIRILSENPGPAFARGFDSKFQQAIQWTLRHCKHTSVHQFLCEVLDYLESRYGQDETFRPIIELWRKEKAHPENWQVKRTVCDSQWPLAANA